MSERYPQYDKVALFQRLRTNWLQSDAFEVERHQLNCYADRHVTVDLTVMKKWMEAGTGVIFATPHYGPFLAGALLFASLGSEANPTHVFYDPVDANPENKRFDDLFKRFKGRLNILHNEPRDLVIASRALKKKQCISIMFDVVQRAADCMLVPLLGRLYPAMGGAAFLSLQSGAPIVPSYVIPDDRRKARIVFGEPIIPETFSGRERENAIYDMTRALFRDFERQLVNAPWHWIYWNNLSRTSRFDESTLRDRSSLLNEIRKRAIATPALVDIIPELGHLISSDEFQ
jgi:lauroyl/myristoyl acyltransferase